MAGIFNSRAFNKAIFNTDGDSAQAFPIGPDDTASGSVFSEDDELFMIAVAIVTSGALDGT